MPSGHRGRDRSPRSCRPIVGLVIAPDIFGLRPLYDDLVARLAASGRWSCARSSRSRAAALGPDVEPPRSPPCPTLDDDAHLRDLHDAARRASATPRVGLARVLPRRHVLPQGGAQRPVRADRQLLRDDPGSPEAWRSARRRREPLGAPRGAAIRTGCSRSSVDVTTTRRPRTSTRWQADRRHRSCRYPGAPNTASPTIASRARPTGPTTQPMRFARAEAWLTRA